MKYVYVENCDAGITKMFEEDGWGIASDLDKADLLCLEGGADVTPALYKEENTHSGSHIRVDVQSLGLITAAEMLGIPIVGICRGSQILNVANGGKMIQHIEGHAGPAHIVPYMGKHYRVTSGHHQESIPVVQEDWVLRAPDGTCEAFFVPSTGRVGGVNLGVQFHPEWAQKGSECRELFYLLLEKVV